METFDAFLALPGGPLVLALAVTCPVAIICLAKMAFAQRDLLRDNARLRREVWTAKQRQPPFEDTSTRIRVAM